MARYDRFRRAPLLAPRYVGQKLWEIRFQVSGTDLTRGGVVVMAADEDTALAIFRARVIEGARYWTTIVNDPGSRGTRPRRFEFRTEAVFGWEIFPMPESPETFTGAVIGRDLALQTQSS